MRLFFLSAVAALTTAALVVAFTACGASQSETSYDTQVAKIVDRLSSSATAISGALISTSEPNDIRSVRSAAESQLRLVSSVLESVSDLETPSAKTEVTAALRKSVLANREYLASVKRAASEDPARGLKAIPATRRDGALMLDGYRAFFRVAPPSISDGITDVGMTDLSGLTKAQRAAAELAKAPPAPSAPAPVGNAQEETFSDIVANSGGEGVRYRYTPNLDNVVPGNGPLEGDTVYISCYTPGEVVKGMSYWARLTNGYYVPTAYLASWDYSQIPAVYC